MSAVLSLCGRQLVHGVDQYADEVRIDVRGNAVAEVEYVAAAVTERIENPPGFGPDTDRMVPITPITEVSDDSWFINLGTFSSHGAARRFANSLASSSHKREIHGVVVAGKNLYRVRVVELPSVEVAEALAMDYQITLGGGRPWVGQN